MCIQEVAHFEVVNKRVSSAKKRVYASFNDFAKFKPAAEFNKALHEAMRYKPVETPNQFAAVENT